MSLDPEDVELITELLMAAFPVVPAPRGSPVRILPGSATPPRRSQGASPEPGGLPPGGHPALALGAERFASPARMQSPTGTRTPPRGDLRASRPGSTASSRPTTPTPPPKITAMAFTDKPTSDKGPTDFPPLAIQNSPTTTASPWRAWPASESGATQSFDERVREHVKSRSYDAVEAALFAEFMDVEHVRKHFLIDYEGSPAIDLNRVSRMNRFLSHCPSRTKATLNLAVVALLKQLAIDSSDATTVVILLELMTCKDSLADPLRLQGLCIILAKLTTKETATLSALLYRSMCALDSSPSTVKPLGPVLPPLALSPSPTARLAATASSLSAIALGAPLLDLALLEARGRFKQYLMALHALIKRSLERELDEDDDNEVFDELMNANPNYEPSVMDATVAMKMLYEMSEKHGLVSFRQFYNETLNAQLRIKDDYPKFKTGTGFSYCNYPFILTTSTKSDILKVESMIQMRHELQDSFFRAMFIGINSPYLVLEVRRAELLRDTMFQLQGKTGNDLKKQLKVSFVGEDGIDEGGVQKEAFQLLIKEIFDHQYGMFVTNEESQLGWFSPAAIQDDGVLEEYKLVGCLLGLAVYNNCVLDLNFPVAMYKKLLGLPVDLEDLKKLDPPLAMGLEQLLAFEGDIQETYDRTFSIEREDGFGARVTVELKPGGAGIPLTEGNRVEFVRLYVDFALNSSCEKQFGAFKAGFDDVLRDTVVTLFRPEELEELICGSPSYDMSLLQDVAQYDGFEPDAPTVLLFWDVVKDFSEDLKKKLLFFTTGTDRVPVGGLAKLNFMIAKNGDDPTRIPTSHTCYNVLMLSEYQTKEQLKERLLMALEYSGGGFYLN